MNNKNKIEGISLVILVVTIIVSIIITGTVVMAINNNNTISNAKEISYKINIDEYNEELKVNISNKYIEDFRFNSKDINASEWDGNVANISGTVKEYIPSMTATDGLNHIIKQGKLIYVGTDITKRQLSKDIGLSDIYIKDGLILWLEGADFKNSPQTTSWIDRSDNGNNAIPNNFNYTTSSGSDGNGSVSFDGLNDNMKIPHNASLVPTDTTMSILFYANNWSSPTANNLIIKRNDIGSNTSYFFFVYTTGALAFDWLTLRWETGYVVPTSKWVSLTITRDSNRRKLYVDGVLISETVGVSPDASGTADLYIGADTNLNRYYYNGKMKSITMYNRALTSDEVMSNYNADKLRFNL
jgi:hypothetical protein